MKKYNIILLLVLFLTVISSIFVTAQTNTYKTITSHVTDFTNTLHSADISKLEQTALHIKTETKVEVALVLIDSFEGIDPNKYATELGQQNGVGDKELDNGVVVVWAKNEQKGYIATGRGIESTLTDLEVNYIGKSARPLFVNGKYYEGFKVILNQISDKVSTTDTNVKEIENIPTGAGTLLTIIIIVMIFLICISILASSSSGGFSGGSTWSSTSFGGGFSSGGSFSGGSFGGGGAGF